MTLLLVGSFLVIVWLAARHAETKKWNGGICKKSGMPWTAFDTDSSGVTGYSDGAGNSIWR